MAIQRGGFDLRASVAASYPYEGQVPKTHQSLIVARLALVLTFATAFYPQQSGKNPNAAGNQKRDTGEDQ